METSETLTSKVSLGALFSALLCFVAANGISYLAMQARLHQIADGYAECGFPFSFYGYGGFAPVSQVLWTGLIADYLVAMFVSIMVGLLWKRVQQRESS